MKFKIKNIKKIDFSNFKKKFKKFYRVDKQGVKGFFSKLSKSFMIPIAILPIAGILLGIGATLSGHTSGDLKIFGNALSGIGDAIFGALPILFAISLAIGFTGGSGIAALAAFVGFIIFSVFQQSFLIEQSDKNGDLVGYNIWFWKHIQTKSVGSFLGFKVIKTGVVGGLCVGGLSAWTYNKFKEQKMPKVLGFFAGERFVSIIMIFFSILLSIFFIFTWPGIGKVLNSFGKATTKLPVGLDSFIEGVGARSLLPLGLHHPFYGSLWWTSAGGSLIDYQGTITINHAIDIVQNSQLNDSQMSSIISSLHHIDSSLTGNQLMNSIKVSFGSHSNIFSDVNNWFHSIKTSTWAAEGDQKIQTAVFGDPTLKIQEVWASGLHVGRFISGGFPLFMFGLPLIGFAMITTIPKEKRKFAYSIYIPSIFTAFLTGVTEPIEFTFLFAAPWLYYAIYVPLAGLSWMLMNLFHSSISVTFSQGLFDYIIYGLLPLANGQQTNPWAVPVVGLIIGFVGFILFRYLILLKNVEIPGRGNSDIELISKSKFKASKQKNSGNDSNLAKQIIRGYGGISNIIYIDACATRLRVDVKDVSKINEKILKESGAIGVVKAGKNIQAIYGPQVSMIKTIVVKEFNGKK